MNCQIWLDSSLKAPWTAETFPICNVKSTWCTYLKKNAKNRTLHNNCLEKSIEDFKNVTRGCWCHKQQRYDELTNELRRGVNDRMVCCGPLRFVRCRPIVVSVVNVVSVSIVDRHFVYILLGNDDLTGSYFFIFIQ